MFKTKQKPSKSGWITLRKRTRKPDAVNMGTCVKKYKTSTSSYYTVSHSLERESRQYNVMYYYTRSFARSRGQINLPKEKV